MDFKGKLRRWNITLISSKKGLLDYRSSYDLAQLDFQDSIQSEQNAEKVIGAPTEEEVKQLILGGENEKIELKPYPDRKNELKKLDFVETVIAFANTHGGLIIVGVSDKCEVIGLPSTENIIEPLASFLYEKVYPPIDFHPRTSSVDGKSVLLINVPESKDKPHMLKDKGIIYVRRNSSDRPATRYDFDEISKGKQNIPGYFRPTNI